MRTLAPVLLAAFLGCAPWREVPEHQAKELERVAPGVDRPQRLKVRVDLESPWLSGQFDGVILVRPGPAVRAQLFPDLGSKVVDLLATPDRIVGYFPMTQEGVDCSLPAEAKPHPILFMGLHLLERAAPVTRERMTGWFNVTGADFFRVRSIVEGASQTFRVPWWGGAAVREISWMYGLSWREIQESPSTIRIEAPRLKMRVVILERRAVESLPAAAFELRLPPEIGR